MKESHKKSKIQLQPLKNSDFAAKKSVLDYQQYEEQLSSYQNSKKHHDITDLFDWTKPSEVIPLQQPREKHNKQQDPETMIIQNNSFNTQQLLRSDDDDNVQERGSNGSVDLDDSIDVDLPHNSPQSTYVQQIKRDYGSEYKLMSQIKLESDLKDMREKIIDMNVRLNKMLDRYQLLAGIGVKKDVQIANPCKLLANQIELNNKIIEKQLYYIKQLEEKDKQLQKKDYLVQLQQLIIEIKKQIHDCDKEKHSQSVDVEKIDKLLKEIEEMHENEDQFRQVKDLKHQIVFYFKKLKEQQLFQDQLQKEMKMLAQRQAIMSEKLSSLSKVAVSNCLEVSSNKNYLQIKKRYDELIVTGQSYRKKKDVALKVQKVAEEKAQKELLLMRKQLAKCQMKIQEIQYQSMSIEQNTKDFITKNNVQNRQLKSISYKFDESLIHPEKGRFKPDFRRVMSRVEGDKSNKTIDLMSRDGDKKFYSINDKNSMSKEVSESIENGQGSDLNISKMKPILRSLKGKGDNARYLLSPQKYKTIENSSNIFRPPPLIKTKK